MGWKIEKFLKIKEGDYCLENLKRQMHSDLWNNDNLIKTLNLYSRECQHVKN